MASLKHLHSYERSKENMEIYRCVHPQCTHFTRRNLIVGKEILCTKCHLPTLARQDQLHAGQTKIGTKALTCVMCSNSPKRFAIQAVEDVLADILPEVGIVDKGEESKSA